ncbi:MAG: sigma 54-interacting transcriptional regulator [Myxococcota bacterium]
MSDEIETLPLGHHEARIELLVIVGGQTQSHTVDAADRVVLGRSRSATITVDHPSISREHARIEFGDRTMFTDLGSSNGSRVRGDRVPPNTPVPVGDGELIELGSALVVVHDHRLREPADRSIRIEIPPDESAMDTVRAAASRAALHGLNVLIQGETGVGKGVIARELHERSPRARGPFVVVDCTSIAPELAESELFGHEAGAFTSARAPKPGLLETGNGGTVFLDEIGDLDPRTQAKLLRVIEERRARRVGSVTEHDIDIRIVAATHRDLEAEVVAGKFRKDLLYRLNAVVIEIPPLRARRSEIMPLAQQFLAEMAPGQPSPTFSADARRWLLAHDWPGNVRELRNVIERAFATMTGTTIELEHVRRDGAPTPPPTAEQMSERDRIVDALERCVGNQTKAAKMLGISRRTLIYRLDMYGLPRPRKKRPG